MLNARRRILLNEGMGGERIKVDVGAAVWFRTARHFGTTSGGGVSKSVQATKRPEDVQ